MTFTLDFKYLKIKIISMIINESVWMPHLPPLKIADLKKILKTLSDLILSFNVALLFLMEHGK